MRRFDVVPRSAGGASAKFGSDMVSDMTSAGDNTVLIVIADNVMITELERIAFLVIVRNPPALGGF
jgi:hypothetical protein